MWACSDHLHGDLDLVLSAGGGESGVQVVPEARLWTGTRLDDDIAELILILSDASMERVVLPVAIEDLVEGEAGAVE
jgi:hypothetical protein